MAYIDKISPAGFHILTLSEIELIQTALGVNAGGKMKTEGFEHWDDPNTGATNETGFSAVGCGKRDWNTGLFSGQRKQAMLWLADEYDASNSAAYTMANGNALLGLAEQWNKKEGLSVRLAMDNPALYTPGMTVTDADGNVYNLVKIHLVDEVPFVINYGLLYNWYAATDARNICAEGWEVPDIADFETLGAYLGGTAVAGGELKETGTTYWYNPNTGATNNSRFNARGSSFKYHNLNSFFPLKRGCYIQHQTGYIVLSYSFEQLYLVPTYDLVGDEYKKQGSSIRLIKTTTSLTHGQTGTYTGNDGKVYRTICIGTQEWLADNLAETKFRNGEWIPGFDGGVYTPFSNSAWAALTTAGLCAYNDDLTNAFVGSPAIDIVVTVENLRTTKYANGDPIVLAQPNNEWINAVGGAYCTFDPAPPQHLLLTTSTPFNVRTKAVGGLSPTIGTNFRKALSLTATAKSLTTSLKTVELKKGKGIAPETSSFVTSLKPTGFVKALGMGATVKSLAISAKTVELIAGTTTPIVYIDPENTASGRDGTIGNPYNSFSEFTIQSNYTYKLKLGVEFQSGTRVYCNGLSNVTFNTYGTGAMPKFIYTGGGDGSTAIMFNNCNSITLDGWDVSGNNGLWAVLRNDNSNKTTINNSYLHHALWQGERGGFGIRGSGSELRILNTTITHTSNDGMYLYDVPYLETGYVDVMYVNLYEPNVPGNNQYGGDGIQINGRYNDYHIHHCLIDRNVDTIGNKYCILIDRGVSDPTLDGGIIEHCTFRANTGLLGSVIIGHNVNTIIRYNTFEYGGLNDGCLKLTGGTVQNTLIYGNKFYGGTGKGITLGYSYVGAGNYGASIGTKIYNNTFFDMAASGGNWGCIWNDKTTVESKNNIFHMNGNTSKAHVNYAGAVWLLENNCYDALSSVGDGGQGTNAVIGDPLFVDKAENDFHLQEGSPCIEAGLALGIDYDFDGVEIPQGTAPCIGAYEFV